MKPNTSKQNDKSEKQMSPKISAVKRKANNRREEDFAENLIELVRTSSLGEWVWNAQINEIKLTAKMFYSLGYEESPDDLTIYYDTLFDRLHPDDRELVSKKIKEHVEGKTATFQMDFRLKARNNSYRWFSASGILAKRSDSGEPLVFVGVISDITRRKSVEQTNRLLAKLPFANPDTVIIMDLNQTIVYLNPTGQKRFGEDIDALFPTNLKTTMEKAYKENRVETINYKIGERHYIMKIKPFSGENQCMVTVTDVTQIIRITDERQLYYDALQSLNQALFITDNEGKIIHVNRAFELLYGYSEDEVMDKKPNVLNAGIETYTNFGYSKADYDELFSDMWQSIRNPDIGKWEGTVINRSKSGKVMWIRLLTNAVYDMNRKISHFVSLPIDITTATSSVNSSKRDLYNAIAELAELRDNETGAHMRRVGIYSKLIAKELNLPEKICDDLEIFAPMHDIGKVGIPDNILLAERNLSEEEFETMKRHTIYGFNIVRKNVDMNLVSEITLNHHERYDGTGYPNGLKGEEIPISARIVALADVYDALRSTRPYKKPWTHEKAYDYIRNSGGTHFDPKIVDIFVKLNKQFEKIYDEIRDNG